MVSLSARRRRSGGLHSGGPRPKNLHSSLSTFQTPLIYTRRFFPFSNHQSSIRGPGILDQFASVIFSPNIIIYERILSTGPCLFAVDPQVPRTNQFVRSRLYDPTICLICFQTVDYFRYRIGRLRT
jgi:hypothetical protein